MFGLSKKALNGGELEFLFITAACTVMRTSGALSAQDLRDYLDATLVKGGYKLNNGQHSVVEAGYATLALSSDLQNLIKQCNKSDGSLDAAVFLKIKDALARMMIRFNC